MQSVPADIMRVLEGNGDRDVEIDDGDAGACEREQDPVAHGFGANHAQCPSTHLKAGECFLALQNAHPSGTVSMGTQGLGS